jgi:uncharacterized protein (DUF1697 family)
VSYVALLRGVNVGGKNRLPMKDLASIFEEAGCSDVRTYIQSGNVVFEARATTAERLPALVSGLIVERFGFRAPVILRTVGELERILRENPLVSPSTEAEALHVMFLAEAPRASAVSGLDAKRSPPDTFAVVGREIYLCCPNGLARTKLTNQYFDTRLATVSTTRNWRTVSKLAELAEP